MAVPTARSVRDPNRYEPPAVAGLVDLLDRQVHDRPEARALVVGGDRLPLSYRSLAALAEDLADQLGGTGLCRGDVIGLVCANTAEFVVGLLGAARVGLVVAPIDPALPESQVSARIGALGPRAILVGPVAPGAAPVAPGAVPTWPLRVAVPGSGAAAVTLEAGAPSAAHVSAAAGELTERDALVLFTAGTTDRAKMVPLTHVGVGASVRAICATYELGPGDATVAAMPFFHGHGLFAGLLASLATGGCVLLPERGRFSAHTFWDDIDAVGATWYTAVPTIHQILLERSKTEPSGTQRAALRFIRSCSAPLTPEVAQALQAEFSAPVLCAFGMTEATHQVTSTGVAGTGQDETPTVSTGLVGRSTGAEIRIVGPDGQPLPSGAVGEVWLHGSTVVRGYLGDPKITAANFTDGWLRTGDLGSLSAGDLSIRGRIKELINRGGEKISPERVEGVLAGHPNVMEAAVFGVPHSLYGEAVAAAIVPRESTPPTPEELAEFCRERLAAFEIPATFELASALPHTAKGSLDRRAVAEQFGRQA